MILGSNNLDSLNSKYHVVVRVSRTKSMCFVRHETWLGEVPLRKTSKVFKTFEVFYVQQLKAGL